jgi:diguanylate cyclase (GGDEF)-like protein/PAS domain S-box-containing protein
MPSGRLIFRHALLSLTFVLLFLLLNLPGTIFLDRLGSSTWYPANGLALALMMLVSPWYALLVACSNALAGALVYHQPLRSFGQTLGAASVAGWYAAAAYLLRGPLRINLNFRRGRDVIRYLAVTSAAALGSTATGVACLAADHTIPWSEIRSAASKWFVGDEIGLLGLAPFLLLHIFPWVGNKLSKKGHAADQFRAHEERIVDVRRVRLLLPEAVGQTLSLLGVLGLMFWPPLGNLLFMSFVPILWIAVRQGVRRVSTGIVALNFGIIIAMHRFPLPPPLASKIGVLMFVVSAAGLIVGSSVTDRLLTEDELRERTVYLNSLIDNSPLGILVLNRDGRVETANDAFTKLFLFEKRTDLAGTRLHDLFPIDPGGETPWSDLVISGQSLHRTLRRQRRDGKIFDLEMQAVPLMVDGGVRGAYAICRDISEQVRASEAEREHAAALNQLVKELELQTDQMTLLNEMANMLKCCATIEEACTVVQDSTRKLFPGAIFIGLYTFRASRNLVEMATSWGEGEAAQSVFRPDACWGLRRGQPHWSDIAAEGGIACLHLNKVPAARHLCVPMVGQGETLGILDVGFAGVDAEPTNFRDSQTQLGVAAAAQIALSLASLQLHEKLRNQSIRDPLTGLFNRRFMQESLDRELIRATRKSRTLSLLFFDIDHFKTFNDTFGHDAGDLVLQSIAELLTRFFRGDDVACRWGGEEFAVILPESISEQAVERANALRAEVKKLELRHRGTALATLTLSIGVATFPEHGSCSEELLRIADQSLYQSKSAGRDCVTVASPMPV